MKKVVLASLFAMNLMWASDITAQYDVDFSVLGTIGTASMHKVQDDDHYVIAMKAGTVGVIAELTKNREDTYISQGTIVDSEYIPDVLVVRRKSDDKEKFTVYKFDHINKTVQKETAETKQVRDQSFDVIHMRIIYTEKEEFSSSSSKHDYYARNDIVSLLFNSPYYIASMQRTEHKMFHAVGIKTDKGELLLSLPVGKNELIRKAEENNAFDIVLKREFFNDGKGVLAITLDPDGFPSSAIMGDVAFYGDVIGKRVYSKIASK